MLFCHSFLYSVVIFKSLKYPVNFQTDDNPSGHSHGGKCCLTYTRVVVCAIVTPLSLPDLREKKKSTMLLSKTIFFLNDLKLQSGMKNYSTDNRFLKAAVSSY